MSYNSVFEHTVKKKNFYQIIKDIDSNSSVFFFLEVRRVFVFIC